MASLVTDPQLEADLIAQRQADGTDKFDEVWEGVYVMSPLANYEHQYLVKELTMVLGLTVDWSGLGETLPGVNISDRKADWRENYRCPDIAVFLNETSAENCDSFCFGGPDLAIEIVSEGDRTHEKIGFYASVGTQELLIVDRDPWKLTLYRLHEARLQPVAESSAATPGPIRSDVVPLEWELRETPGERIIRLVHAEKEQAWTIRL